MDKEVINVDILNISTQSKDDTTPIDSDILQNDRWVTEIESTDGHLGTTLRFLKKYKI